MKHKLFSPSLMGSVALCAALLVPALGQAATVDLSGVKLEDRVTVAGAPLVLNGAGVRYKAVFQVYTAGLYLSANLLHDLLQQARHAAPMAIEPPSVPSGLVDAVLARDSIGGDWLASDVTRVAGVVHLTVILPHAADLIDRPRRLEHMVIAPARRQKAPQRRMRLLRRTQIGLADHRQPRQRRRRGDRRRLHPRQTDRHRRAGLRMGDQPRQIARQIRLTLIGRAGFQSVEMRHGPALPHASHRLRRR